MTHVLVNLTKSQAQFAADLAELTGESPEIRTKQRGRRTEVRISSHIYHPVTRSCWCGSKESVSNEHVTRVAAEWTNGRLRNAWPSLQPSSQSLVGALHLAERRLFDAKKREKANA